LTYPLTAIISDLHGNIPALEVALADCRARKVERTVCLGDVVGYGAQPREALDLVMERCYPTTSDRVLTVEDGFCLQGNHEEALLGSAADFNGRARRAIEWTREELSRGEDVEQDKKYWNFAGALLPRHSDGVAMFAHGSPRDPVREYMLPSDVNDPEKLQANFECMEAPICFVGHSHVPAIYYEDNRFFQPKGTQGPFDLGDLDEARAIVNVGSVGQPRDGDPRLCYALFDGQYLTFVRLEYDIASAQAAIRAVPDLPEELADRLAVGR
jgi:diadenosine tetraphosphatase ApaH/serine/threonine PP2A family protein phosphatase